MAWAGAGDYGVLDDRPGAGWGRVMQPPRRDDLVGAGQGHRRFPDAGRRRPRRGHAPVQPPPRDRQAPSVPPRRASRRPTSAPGSRRRAHRQPRPSGRSPEAQEQHGADVEPPWRSPLPRRVGVAVEPGGHRRAGTGRCSIPKRATLEADGLRGPARPDRPARAPAADRSRSHPRATPRSPSQRAPCHRRNLCRQAGRPVPIIELRVTRLARRSSSHPSVPSGRIGRTR